MRRFWGLREKAAALAKADADKAAKEEAARITREADIRRLYEIGTQLEVLEQLYDPSEVAKVMGKVDKERELLRMLEEELIEEPATEESAVVGTNVEEAATSPEPDASAEEADDNNKDSNQEEENSENTEGIKKRYSLRFASIELGDLEDEEFSETKLNLDESAISLQVDDDLDSVATTEDINEGEDGENQQSNDDEGDHPNNPYGPGPMDDLMMELMGSQMLGVDGDSLEDSQITETNRLDDSDRERENGGVSNSSVGSSTSTSGQQPNNVQVTIEGDENGLPVVVIDTSASQTQSSDADPENQGSDHADQQEGEPSEKSEGLPGNDDGKKSDLVGGSENNGVPPAETDTPEAASREDPSHESSEKDVSEAETLPQHDSVTCTGSAQPQTEANDSKNDHSPQQGNDQMDNDLGTTSSAGKVQSAEEPQTKDPELIAVVDVEGDEGEAMETEGEAMEEDPIDKSVDAMSEDMDVTSVEDNEELTEGGETGATEDIVEDDVSVDKGGTAAPVGGDMSTANQQQMANEESLHEEQAVGKAEATKTEHDVPTTGVSLDPCEKAINQHARVQNDESIFRSDEVKDMEHFGALENAGERKTDKAQATSTIGGQVHVERSDEDDSSPSPCTPDDEDEDDTSRQDSSHRDNSGDNSSSDVSVSLPPPPPPPPRQQSSPPSKAENLAVEEFTPEQPPPQPLSSDNTSEEVLLEVVEEAHDILEEEIVDDERPSELDCSAATIEEEILDDGSSSTIVEEIVEVLEEEVLEQLEVFEEDVVESAIVDESMEEEVISDGSLSSDSEYVDQVIHKWIDRDEEPDDYEAAVNGLAALVYKDGEADIEKMKKRTPQPELYRYLKQQYWYKIHMKPDQASASASSLGVEEDDLEKSQTTSVDDMLANRLNSLLHKIRTGEEIKPPVSKKEPEPSTVKKDDVGEKLLGVEVSDAGKRMFKEALLMFQEGAKNPNHTFESLKSEPSNQEQPHVDGEKEDEAPRIEKEHCGEHDEEDYTEQIIEEEEVTEVEVPEDLDKIQEEEEEEEAEA